MKKIIAIIFGVVGFIALDILTADHPVFLVLYLCTWIAIGVIGLIYRFITTGAILS